MSGIHKEQMYLSCLGLLYKWFQDVCFESFLRFNISFNGNLFYLATENPVFFRNSRTCGKER
jgi:hypothetical protein